ncbi:hypothetical protein IAT40_003198 [Kwoniella sp. CBS 6097]
MADDIGSWISQAIIAHDKEYGANRDIPLKGRYVQLVEFSSYRTSYNPDAEIQGVVSDRTHHVRVKFDVEATNEFEEPQASLPPESLTSHLRSIFLLESYTIHLEAPISSAKKRTNHNYRQTQPSPFPDLPRVLLGIKKWKVVGGSKDDPIYFDKTAELGRGSGQGEGRLQQVLRKWWFGESNSDPSQNLTSSMETPSKISWNARPLISSPMNPPHVTPQQELPIRAQSTATSNGLQVHEAQPGPSDVDEADPVLILDEFLRPYLHPTGGKKRTIPEWLFETPEETRRMLDDISLFALDLAISPRVQHSPGLTAEASMATSTDRKGKGRAVVLPSGDQEEAEELEQPQHAHSASISPVPRNMRESIASTSHRPNDIIRSSPSPHRVNDLYSSVAPESKQSITNIGSGNEDSDEEIPVRPVGCLQKKKRSEIFDPLAMPSSSPAPLEDVEDSEPAQEKVDRDNGFEPSRRIDEGVIDDEIDEEIEDDVFGVPGRKRSAETEETDEEALSEYERQQRRAKKQKAAARSADKSDSRSGVAMTGTLAKEKRRSVSASVAVQTDLDIDIIPEPASSAVVYAESTRAHILVDDSDQSLPLTSQSQRVSDGSASAKQSRPSPSHLLGRASSQASVEPRRPSAPRPPAQSQASPSQVAKLTQSDGGHDADISGSFEEPVHQAGDSIKTVHHVINLSTSQVENGISSQASPEKDNPTRTRSRTEDNGREDLSRISKRPKVEFSTPVNVNRSGPSNVAQSEPRNTPASVDSSGRGTRKSFLQSIRFFSSSPPTPATPASPSAKLSQRATGGINRHDRSANADAVEPMDLDRQAQVQVTNGESDESKKIPGLLSRLGEWAGAMPHYDQSDDEEDDDDNTRIHIEELGEENGHHLVEEKAENRRDIGQERPGPSADEDVDVKPTLEPGVVGTSVYMPVRILEPIEITDSDLDGIFSSDDEEDDAGPNEHDDLAASRQGNGADAEKLGMGVGVEKEVDAEKSEEVPEQSVAAADDEQEQVKKIRDGPTHSSLHDAVDSDRDRSPPRPGTETHHHHNHLVEGHDSRGQSDVTTAIQGSQVRTPSRASALPLPPPSPSPNASNPSPPISSAIAIPEPGSQSIPSPTESLVKKLGGKARKLGGYELDLKVDGLSGQFVQRALENALRARNSKKVR